jgi:hypothetical protein
MPKTPMTAFLSDLWEQADQMRQQLPTPPDPRMVAILDELQARLAALGLVAQTAEAVERLSE